MAAFVQQGLKLNGVMEVSDPWFVESGTAESGWRGLDTGSRAGHALREGAGKQQLNVWKFGQV